MRRAAVLASLERLKRYLRDYRVRYDPAAFRPQDAARLRVRRRRSSRHLEEAIRTIKRHWKSDAGLP
jgi:hypothetical protein